MQLIITEYSNDIVEIKEKEITVEIADFDTGVGAVPVTSIVAKGDLLVGVALEDIGRLAVGSDGKILAVDSAEETGLKWTTPDSGTRNIYLPVVANYTNLATGDGAFYFTVPPSIDGFELTEVYAAVYTTSSSGLPTVQIHNMDDGAGSDMLSTRVTIDEGELNSFDPAIPPVIDIDHNAVAKGDRIRIDIDVAGTGTKGLDVILVFTLP
jgi:hypothetical protein